ncbi:rna-directed dna polymerase from mobile element jockey-like [Limosa lapponica baueri]|uniref:Rna-directed dna polymerase from mobile element jockey-like n=1 Tax=Limosa lapponica baueri TaxID=1758121 RepID=A0A2I0U495_LIMLA|nr:rna-directed dna polymerase from mobile element jockey-like [Limosa lapponica baueri]
MGPVLFNIFISDLDHGAECILSKFADDSRPGGVTDKPEDGVAIQRDLHRLEKRAERNPMQFNKRKFKVLHLERNNARQQCIMGANLLESIFTEKHLGLLVITKLNMSQ